MCRVGSQIQESAYMKLPKDGQILGFILVHKSQLDVSQEGGVFSGTRQNDVIKDKIDLWVFP